MQPNRLKKIQSQLLHENGVEPSEEMIAEKMDLPVERVREIMRVAQEPVSMETPIGPEEDSRLMDFIRDEDALAPDDAALKSITNEDIDGVLKTLTPREEAVIRLRFGLKDGREAATKFMDSLKLAKIVVHVADARTCVLHPASTTHRPLTDEQLRDAGVLPELVRLSVGIENVEDIIDDVAQALANA